MKSLFWNIEYLLTKSKSLQNKTVELKFFFILIVPIEINSIANMLKTDQLKIHKAVNESTPLKGFNYC